MADISDKVINVIIGVVLVFLIIGNLAATVITAAGNISGSHCISNCSGTQITASLPLAGLFGASGVVLIIVMIGFMKKIIKMTKD